MSRRPSGSVAQCEIQKKTRRVKARNLQGEKLGQTDANLSCFYARPHKKMIMATRIMEIFSLILS